MNRLLQLSTLTLVLALLLASSGAYGTQAAFLGAGGKAGRPAAKDAPTATTVSINPISGSAADCGILDLYIDVNDVTNLYALDVRLSFDPAQLEVVEFSPGQPLEPVIDPNLNFIAGFTVRNIVDNFAGTIWYATTQTAPTPPAAGTGHVARLRVRAKTTAAIALTFTYIKLSSPGGVEIPATGTNGTVNGSSTVFPILSISRLNTTQVQLSWPVASGVSKYHLYRSTTPYFNPTGTAYQVLTAGAPASTQTFNDSVLGNVTTNYFYALRAECSTPTGSLSAASRQVGKFEFPLYETTGTDYSWVGLIFDGQGLTNALSLANHIQNNSNATVSVKTISRWNGSGQNISAYNNGSSLRTTLR